MSELSENIQRLRAEGLSFRDIQKELGCSKSTISYHLSEGQKAKTLVRQAALRGQNGLLRKVQQFKTVAPSIKERSGSTSLAKKNQNKLSSFQEEAPHGEWSFSYQDVVVKNGPNPTCYLTGDLIDYNSPSDYHFDHMIPRSKGGSNGLDNLGLTTKRANQMKGDMTLDELLEMCERVLRHHGRM